MTTISLLFSNLTLAVAGTLLCASAALAVDKGVQAESLARYRQDIADCNSVQTAQDPGTCRREARNALAEARRGGLKDAADEYQKNALQRCAVQQGDDRTACEARMRGQGSVKGSVAGGGILRETVTVVPGN